MRALLFVILFCPLANGQSSSAGTITDADEIRAGEVLAAKFESFKGLAPTAQTIKIEKYLQSVGDRVAAHAQRRLPYRFHFDPDPSFKSGIALPGGQIFVGGGILAYMDTEDQLAAVLGHEIEHVALGQCRDRLILEMAKQHLSAADLSKLELDPFFPGYGDDGEFAADRGGLKLAMEAGYSATAAVRLLQTFVILGQQVPNAPSGTKSNLQARFAQAQALADSAKPMPKERPLALPE
jgi:beta-barrel assembly-enhancing protease